MEDFMCNVLIMGKTGTGKSSLLNYICDANLAQSGSGKPVTGEGFYDYVVKINNQNIRIYDTWGIEAGKIDRWKKLIEDSLMEHGTQKSIEDWFHSVIYCVQAGGGRIEDIDIQIIKQFLDEGYKLTIVLTKSDQVSESVKETMNKAIVSAISGKRTDFESRLKIIATCAEKKITRNGETIPFGRDEVCKAVLDNWRDTIMERIPKHVVGRICERINAEMEAIKKQISNEDRGNETCPCPSPKYTISGIYEENAHIYNDIQNQIKELADGINTRYIPEILEDVSQNCHKANMALSAMMNVEIECAPLKTTKIHNPSWWPLAIGTLASPYIPLVGIITLLSSKIVRHIRANDEFNIEAEKKKLFDYIDEATEKLITQCQSQETVIAEQLKKIV